MKRLFSLLLFFFQAFSCISQTEEFVMYYPTNPRYKKLKVKSVLDTTASPPGKHYKKEFDTLGRQTAWYYVEDSVRTYFKYEQAGDTLLRLHFYTKNGKVNPVYRFERFVYNAKRKIVLYQSCERNYGTETETSKCETSRFYYNKNGHLLKQINYSNDTYPFPFSERMQLSESGMDTTSISVYEYDRAGRVASKKQLLGKPEERSIERFYYDKLNRVVKSVGYSKKAYSGHAPVKDLTSVETVKYERDRITKMRFSTYRLEWEKSKLQSTEVQISEYKYYPSGLLKAWYQKNGNHTKSMLTYNVYDFYK